MSEQTSGPVCVICGTDDGVQLSTLGERGCQGINAACQNQEHNLRVEPGQSVHPVCRKNLCHPNQRRQPTNNVDDITSPKTRLSAENKFDFKTKCLFCGTNAVYNSKYKPKRGRDVHPVMTLEFQETIKDICYSRNDMWANTVLGRLEYACDLPAVEARYHQNCCTNFRSGYQIPKHFVGQLKFDSDLFESCSEAKKGRPVHVSAENAFKQVLSTFENNLSGQLTVNDLVEEMKTLCGDDAYSNVYMKKKVLEHYGGNVIITEMNGKTNVVTFKSSAHEILHSFYCRANKDDSECEKMSIIKTAGKLIMDDIKSMNISKENYPSSADIMSTEVNLDFVPASLQCLLGQLIDSKDWKRITASLGQALIQAAIPRSIITPIQIGLGVQLHHHFGSKFLIDTLNSLGFCSSYTEVQRFEKSAAVSENPVLVTSSKQFAADWGWSKSNDKLAPVKCDLPPAPERLLKIVRCSCKTNCDTRRCTCRKHGLSCSTGCGDCKGVSCSNRTCLEEDYDCV